jgi:hypothetical protein
MAMNSTALFISAMALAATPIFVVLAQDSSVDQEIPAPSSAAATQPHQRQPSSVTRSVHRNAERARCTSTGTAHPSCRARH